MVGTSKQLFSFLAARIEEFVREHHSEHFEEDPQHHLQLGFTFSFPVDQKSVNRGYLIRWTKGFDIKDAVGKDVCALLQQEIDLLGIAVNVAALVNDTVGTLMSRSYTSPGKTGTLLGGIFGTGTNGAYVEKLERITKMTTNEKTKGSYGPFDKSTGEMVVNTEWGAFDNAMKVLPDTPYDRALDAVSVNPGMQMFEKRISGMFLGEILRHALLTLKNEVDLFSAPEISISESSNLYVPWSIDTSFLSNVEGDSTPDLSVSRKLIESDLGVTGATQADAEAIRIVSRAVGKRSARLSAIPIAAIVISAKLSGENQYHQKINEGVALESSMRKLSVGQTVTNVAQQVKEAVTNAVDSIVQAVSPVVDNPPSTVVAPATEPSTSSSSTSAPVPVPPLDAPAKTVSGNEDDIIDIGVDGSVVEYYPGFESYLREALREVKELGERVEQRIRIGIAKDGSGVGAALIALVAARKAGK